MNKQQLKKLCAWKKSVRLRPVPRRFNGSLIGRELEPLDRLWEVGAVTNEFVELYLPQTGHGIRLKFDHIREYLADVHDGNGFLRFKVQLRIGGNRIVTDPL